MFHPKSALKKLRERELRLRLLHKLKLKLRLKLRPKPKLERKLRLKHRHKHKLKLERKPQDSQLSHNTFKLLHQDRNHNTNHSNIKLSKVFNQTKLFNRLQPKDHQLNRHNQFNKLNKATRLFAARLFNKSLFSHHKSFNKSPDQLLSNKQFKLHQLDPHNNTKLFKACHQSQLHKLKRLKSNKPRPNKPSRRDRLPHPSSHCCTLSHHLSKHRHLHQHQSKRKQLQASRPSLNHNINTYSLAHRHQLSLNLNKSSLSRLRLNKLQRRVKLSLLQLKRNIS